MTYSATYAAARISRGLCRDCGKPRGSSASQVFCGPCRERITARQARRRARERKERARRVRLAEDQERRRRAPLPVMVDGRPRCYEADQPPQILGCAGCRHSAIALAASEPDLSPGRAAARCQDRYDRFHRPQLKPR